MTTNVTANPQGSLLFAAGGSLVSYTNSAFAVGTGNFTAECWVWMDPSSNANAGFMATCSSTTGGLIMARNIIGVYSANGVSGNAVSVTIATSVWVHIAAVCSSSSLTVYINGTSAGTVAVGSLSNSTLALASRYTDISFPFVGYITNARFVAGVAVYTGNFTVPVSPLTGIQSSGTNISAITGVQTKLLCSTANNASYLADSSSLNLTATTSGTVTANTLTPFTASGTLFNLTTDPVGSVSFNGSSQYLSIPSNAVFGYGTGDFTIEFWLYLNTTSLQTIFSNLQTTSGTQPHIYYSGTSLNYYTVGAPRITGSALSTNTWYHVAISKSSGSTKLFINGIQSGSTYADSNDYGTSNPVTVGQYWTTYPGTIFTANYLNGYISNLRVVKGVAVYTGNFTPPTRSLRGTQAASSIGSNISGINAAQTSLLLQTPNTASFITDSSIYASTFTNTGSVVASALSPFSTASSTVWNGLTLGSASLNGTSQSLTTTVTTSSPLDLAAGAGNWTIESWFYLTSVAGSASVLWKTAGANPAYCFWISTTTLQWIVGDGAGGGTAQNLATAIAANNWYHFALVRNSTTLTPYLNGVAGTPVTISFTQGNGGASTTLYVGAASDGRFFPGYISNPRITKGVAVYTGAFTPPNQPLTVTQSAGTNISAITGTQTSLLLNTWANFLPFYDSSSNYSITNNGSATTSQFTPFATTVGPVAMSYTNPALITNGSWVFSNSSLGALNLTASTPQYSFGTGDFTVEFWMYTNALSSNQGPVSFMSNTIGNYITGQWEFQLTSTLGGLLSLVYATGLSATNTIQSSVITGAGQWWHVALVRIGSGANNMKLYINGTVAGQDTVTQAFGTTGAGRVGLRADGSVANYFNGYITNLRVVKGVGVYTGTFTPPTSPLTITQPAGANIAAITSPSSTTLLGKVPISTNISFNDFSVYNPNTSFSNPTGNVTATAFTPFTSFG